MNIPFNTLTRTLLCLGLILFLSSRAQTETRSTHEASLDDASLSREVARLKNIMGVMAKTYTFELKPTEELVVHVQSKNNGIIEEGDTFTKVFDFAVYQEFNKNYPTFQALTGERWVDVEIQQPGHSWNPDQIKISLQTLNYHKFFYFDKPSGSRTQFGKEDHLMARTKNTLLDLEYRGKDETVRTLTIKAEIRPTSPKQK